MKVKKQLIVGILILLIALLLPTISRAGIESKPGATEIWRKITVSDAYKACYDLRYPTSTLGTNTLDPHLSLNKDWGAVAYLGLSSYGAVRNSTGPSITINDTSYTTTTGNKTGIMDLGKTYTYTASIIEGTATNNNIANLVDNLNTKYVETLDKNDTIDTTKGQAFAETKGWYSSSSSYVSSSYPVGVRYKGICGYYNGTRTSNSDVEKQILILLSAQQFGTKSNKIL